MNEIKLTDKNNIYTAYLRVKNSSYIQNDLRDGEIFYFEKELSEHIETIQNEIKNSKKFELNPYCRLFKLKKLDVSNGDHEEKRPLTSYSFYDSVKIQAIMNNIIDELEYTMPLYNYGVVCEEQKKPYTFSYWPKHYNEYQQRFKKNIKGESKFQYVYSFDLKNFYPSISHKSLIKKLEEDLKFNDEKNEEILHLIKIIIDDYYDSKTETTKYGLPQGPDSSRFLSIYYIKNLKEYFLYYLNKIVGYSINKQDIDFFMYVDDGFFFSVDDITEEDFILAMKLALCEIDIGKKIPINSEGRCGCIEAYKKFCENTKLTVNNDKCKKTRLDYKELRYLLTNLKLSEFRGSIQENQYISNDQYDQIEEVNSVVELRQYISLNENESSDQSNLNILTDILDLHEKRTVSIFSRLNVSRKKFYEQIKKFININYEIKQSNDNKDKEKKLSLDNINFEYVFKELLNKCETKQDYRYLFNRIFKVFNQRKEKCKNRDVSIKGFQFYDSIILTNLLSIDPNFYIEDNSSVDEFLHGLLTNKTIHVFEDSYKLEVDKKDILYYVLTCINSNFRKQIPEKFYFGEYEKSIKELSSFEQETIYKLKDDLLSNISKEEFYFDKNEYIFDFYNCLNEEKENEDSELTFKLINTINAVNDESEQHNDGDKMLFTKDNRKIVITSDLDTYHLNNTVYLSDSKQKDVVKGLTTFWLNEFKDKKLINPSITNPNNVVISNNNINLFKNEIEFNHHLNEYIPNEIYRKNLLKLFLNIFGIDRENYHQNDIKFWQFRILVSLNNQKFNLKSFLLVLEDIITFNDLSEIITLDIFKATDIFLYEFTYSDSIEIIDKLLKIHQYYSNAWKNGSKDLFFFTLHNQLHSLTLIENFHKFNKSIIRGFSINKHEKFLLFAACYLHDIGMLMEAEDEEILRENRIMFSEDNVNNSSIIKNTNFHNMSKAYKEYGELIENYVRKKHAIQSHNQIITCDFLPLTTHEAKIVAIISKNHNVESTTVYGTPIFEKLNNTNINVRKLSIWLRFLDLSDVGKERVTAEVMELYGNRMPTISIVNWIKHLTTNDISFTFELVGKEKQILKSYTRPTLNEVLNPKINLNFVINLNYIPNHYKLINTEPFTYKYKLNKDEDVIICKDNNASTNNTLLTAFLNEYKFFENEVKKFGLTNELCT